MKRFFVMNTDLFIRSLCFIGIYIGFTTFSAHYGDLLLASGTILMKIMMLFSYFTDGFAYAGEALAGRYIGAGDKASLMRVIRFVFVWSLSIGVGFMFLYAFAGLPILKVMTNDYQVIDISLKYMPWMVMMPLFGCAAFAWDGIYIGATASRPIRNTMILAAAGFFLTYFAGLGILRALSPSPENFSVLAIHILLAAYLAHLIIRTVYLSARFRVWWNPEGLGLTVQVRDNRFVFPDNAPAAWQNDSVQVYFDMKRDATPTSGKEGKNEGDDCDYIISLLNGRKAVAYLNNGSDARFIGGSNQTRGIDSALKLSWERPDEHTLIYHIFFPAATLPYISFREGTSFGFSLLVNDDDGKGRKDGLTLAPKGTEPFRNPHLYKDLVLIR